MYIFNQWRSGKLFAKLTQRLTSLRLYDIHIAQIAFCTRFRETLSFFESRFLFRKRTQLLLQEGFHTLRQTGDRTIR